MLGILDLGEIPRMPRHSLQRAKLAALRRDLRRRINRMPNLLQHRHLLILNPSRMPRLEKDLASDLVDGAGYLLPRGCVIGVVHDGRMRPLGAVWGDECTLCDDEAGPVARSVDVVLDTGLGGLVGVRAAVTSHGAHADAVAEGDAIAEDHWLQEFCHFLSSLYLWYK